MCKVPRAVADVSRKLPTVAQQVYEWLDTPYRRTGALMPQIKYLPRISFALLSKTQASGAKGFAHITESISLCWPVVTHVPNHIILMQYTHGIDTATYADRRQHVRRSQVTPCAKASECHSPERQHARSCVFLSNIMLWCK